MANKKILLGLTTITEGEWRNKVKEIDKLGLKEIALFPTCLDMEQRQELYGMLEKTGLEKIPYVHLREEDFAINELEYLMDKYGVEVFSAHASALGQKFIEKNHELRKKIFVENINVIAENFEYMAKQGGGLCLDLAHWEDYGNIQKVKGYEILPGLVKKYKIGLNHISAIKQKLGVYHDRLTGQDYTNFNSHNLSDLSELDYVKKYKNYLADIISIELENPLKRQLEVREYLIKILDL